MTYGISLCSVLGRKGQTSMGWRTATRTGASRFGLQLFIFSVRGERRHRTVSDATAQSRFASARRPGLGRIGLPGPRTAWPRLAAASAGSTAGCFGGGRVGVSDRDGQGRGRGDDLSQQAKLLNRRHFDSFRWTTWWGGCRPREHARAAPGKNQARRVRPTAHPENEPEVVVGSFDPIAEATGPRTPRR